MTETILDYVRWRGDLAFAERPLNEVDSLILSELAYYDFSEVMRPDEITAGLSLAEVWQRHQALAAPRRYPVNDPCPLMAACAETVRFGTLRVRFYVSLLDRALQMQFAAVTFQLPDGTAFAAYRGTDNTLIGWREDFNFSYLPESPAQAEAVRYLDELLQRTDVPVILGGHSKGGHLANYAAAFCRHPAVDRVRLVYSNDGPGFNPTILEQPEYEAALPKVRLIIPESSVIGPLYFTHSPKVLIRSMGTTPMQQHDPYTWLVERDHFLRTEHQSQAIQLLDEAVDKWLLSLDVEQRQLFFSSVFDVLDASGAATLNELHHNRWGSYSAILHAAALQSLDAKSNFRESMIKLAEASREVFWNEAKKRFEPLSLSKALSSLHLRETDDTD